MSRAKNESTPRTPMKLHKWADIRRTRLTPAEIEEQDRLVAQDLLEMDLAEIRSTSGKTQVEVAKAAEMTQSELSKVERRDDHLVSTLRRIVEALGGELEIRAVFENRTVRLR